MHNVLATTTFEHGPLDPTIDCTGVKLDRMPHSNVHGGRLGTHGCTFFGPV